jgi:hypothetical protein
MAQSLRRRPHAAAPQHTAAASPARFVPLLLALGIAALFAALLLGTLDFSLGTHGDEKSKIYAVLRHTNNYKHPLLMLEIVRAANALAGLADRQALVELGRACAVIAGALGVFATYLLARESLPVPAALAAAAATAVTPLVAMHARHLKEDIFLLPLLLLSLLALIATLKAPTLWRAILLGLAIGLAAAAKYVALALLPFAVIVLLVGLHATRWRERLGMTALVGLVAGATFALIHVPVVWDYAQFKISVAVGVYHAKVGMGPRVPLELGRGLFHLRESLLPGLGAPLFILGLLGFAAPWLAPPKRRMPLLVIAAFAALWLVAHELSPFKPYPDFQRYMVPVAPLFVILGTASVYELAQRRVPAWSASVAAAAILIAATPALYVSLRIAGPPKEDLRRIVPKIVLPDTPNAAFDDYTRFHRGGQPARHGRPPAERTSLLVTSNFVYDRYLEHASAPLQPHDVRARAARYAELFTHPFLEVSNGRPAFAFFNPVLRIVALDGDAGHLETIAGELRRKYPNVSITLVNAGARD